MQNIHIFGLQFSTYTRVVQLVCEEKGIPYTLGLTINGSNVEFKSDKHLAIHPFGKIPVISHNDQWLAETSSICRYLEANFSGPSLMPVDPYQAALVDQWQEYLAGTLNHAIIRDYLLELVFPKGVNGQPRLDVMRKNQAAAQSAITLISTQLGSAPYLVGEQFTLADAMAAPSLYYLSQLEGEFALIEPGSNMADYCARLKARPASKNVLIPKT